MICALKSSVFRYVKTGLLAKSLLFSFAMGLGIIFHTCLIDLYMFSFSRPRFLDNGFVILNINKLIYVVPFAIIILISLEIRHLYRWINKDSITVNQNKNEFMDYYVVLDLKKDADIDEIEKAFNSAMAKYNSANGNPLYGKQFYYEIQEAYAVLGSTNQLRPEYDKEYEAYKSSNCASYSYSNKQLENEILNIRNKLYKVKSGNSSRKINIIIVSFILFLVVVFIILSLFEIVPPLWEGHSNLDGSKGVRRYYSL